MEHPEELEERRAYISSERERVFAALQRMPRLVPFPSEGNFILIDVSGTGRTSGEIVEFAKRENMLLRQMTAHRLKDAFVRVTIGTIEQNDRFIDIFGRAIAAEAVTGAGSAGPGSRSPSPAERAAQPVGG